MSSIIKSANVSGQTDVHTLAGHASAAQIIPIGKHDEERDNLLRRIAWLEEQLRQRSVETDNLRAEVTRARDDGREQGYEIGLAAAQDRQSERLRLLEKSMMQAQTAAVECLTSLSRLSTLLAQDCVDIILGDASDRTEFISSIIETQLAKIDRAMLISIDVSRLDFPNDQLIAALVEKRRLSSVSVKAADDMPSGSCVINLRLGRIAVGINQQWPALKAVLDEMSLPEMTR